MRENGGKTLHEIEDSRAAIHKAALQYRNI
jgi:hypothetical protein